MKLNSGVVSLAWPTCLVILILGILFFPTHFFSWLFSPPVVVGTYPVQDEVGVPSGSRETISFNKGMDPKTINSKTMVLYDDHNEAVPADVSYEKSSHTAVLSPYMPLRPGAQYRLAGVGGNDGIKDRLGHALAKDLAWTFSTGVESRSQPVAGPGGPILLITSSANGFSEYYAEILRNEGFNEFENIDVSKVDASVLKRFEIAVLGEVPVNEVQIAALSQWVSAGGDLIAMRPDAKLARAFGFQIENGQDHSQANSSLHDAYLSILPNTGEGAGLVHQSIQFHGPATYYRASSGTALATLYSDATTPTSFPAVIYSGLGHGRFVLFSYDLARSVILTRQGNPQWSGEERDGVPPIRSDDLFYGAAASDPEPDWVDPVKVAIPQADEQQRLFANIITLSSRHKMPLPHFWYLPRGLKAAIIMTGDDHGGGGTVKRFEGYMARSPKDCSLENWECIRATSNVFVGSIRPTEAPALVGEGFEIGLHVYTACADWPSVRVTQPDGMVMEQVDRENAEDFYRNQLAAFASAYPGVPSPVSNRIDCVTWGDYDSQPQIELNHRMRLDENYYYWPAKWVRNRPGMFTGSGMPMRFAKRDGHIVDVYQAATQLTDESGQQYPYTIDTLLTNALGPSEFYGVFTANMHNDKAKSEQADAIITAALAHHIPVVTAAQMLNWLDGRNTSSFEDLIWSGGQLSFHVDIGENANGLQILMPLSSDAGKLASLTLNGASVQYQRRSIAGLAYAAFPARPGKIQATYSSSKQ